MKTTAAGATALELISRIVTRNAQHVQEAIAAGTFSHIESPRPSEWVCRWELQKMGVRSSTIHRLIRDGLIESRTIDGFGCELRRTDWEEQEIIGTTCFHCGAPAMRQTHYHDPRCERHRDV